MSFWLKPNINKGLGNVCADCNKRFLCHAICNNMQLIEQIMGNNAFDRANFDSIRLLLEQNEFGYPKTFRHCDYAENSFKPLIKVLDEQACLYERLQHRCS